MSHVKVDYQEIDDFPGYWVSSDGFVWGPRQPNNLKFDKVKGGYLRVRLYKNGAQKAVLVHRLVATQFIPNPKNLPQVNHIDKDVTNNSVVNLEWCDAFHNAQHSHAKEYRLISPSGEKVTVLNLNKHCREYNLSRGTMSQVTAKIRKHHKGWRLDECS